ncbi:MAG: diguanylate phosphodiesterase, partial [Acinetobacter sp.]
MGSIEVRNPLLSKKLKRTETRLLIIDDNQIRFNQILDLLTSSGHVVHATLLDDLQNFEKQLHQNWDLVIFGRAYDLKYEQALSLI